MMKNDEFTKKKGKNIFQNINIQNFKEVSPSRPAPSVYSPSLPAPSVCKCLAVTSYS